jgi:hypothetical protein
MTEEIPEQPKHGRGIVCDECNEQVRLERDSGSSLTATCDCDQQRSIRVAAVLPDGWQP